MEVDKPDRATPSYDDIDMFELIQNVGNQKLLIALFMSLFVALGGIYTVVAPEEWTAEALLFLPADATINVLYPPELEVFKSQTQIYEPKDQFSVPGLSEIGSRMGAEQVMVEFLAELHSVETLLSFEAVVEEPFFRPESTPTEEKRIDAASNFLVSNLKVTAPSNGIPHYKVELVLDNPDKAARTLNDYLTFVNTKVIQKLQRDLELRIRRLIKGNEIKIQRANRSFEHRREENLARLEEALQIARAAGIQDNQSGLFVDRNDNRLIGANDLYLRGEKLLLAAIQALENKIEASDSILQARELESDNALLKGIQIDTTNATAYTLDKPATPPTSRDAPKTLLVLALALALGGMTGVITALIRTALRCGKAREAP